MINEVWMISAADLARRRTIEGDIDEISVVRAAPSPSGLTVVAEVRGFSRLEALTHAVLISRAPAMASLLRQIANHCEGEFSARGRWGALPNDLVHAICAMANANDLPPISSERR